MRTCRAKNVTNPSSKLPAAATSVLVQTLLDQLPMDDHATVISVKQDNVPASPTTNGQLNSTSLPRYDPTVAYILEFSTLLATRDADTIENSAKQVFDTVQGILRDPIRWHAITVSRATFYALKILRASYVSHSPRLDSLVLTDK